MSVLTPAAEAAWRVAAAEAGSASHARIERAHVLVGLLSLEKLADSPRAAQLPPEVLAGVRDERARLHELLQRAGLEPRGLRRALRARLGRGPGAPAGGVLSRSDSCKAAFRRAEDLAGPGPASCLHLLAALAEEPDPQLRVTLVAAGIEPHRLQRLALAFAEGSETRRPAEPLVPGQLAPAPSGDTPTLDRFGRDLTALAARGELGPVVGRRTELLQLLQTLARAGKSNPLLVGEAGVGKTAVVAALALRAAQGKDPAVLAGVRIVELDLGALVAGTSHRGEFEQRVERLLNEARAHPEVILFLDELHTLAGTGRVGDGALDAAQLLKPALARGELRLIGATTPEDYARHVEPDAALARRFERIDVKEPSRQESLEMLRGLRPRWEQHHGVALDDLALQAAVDLSLRFEPDRRLPDKAVDLVDQACARARVPLLSQMAAAPAAEGPRAAPRETVTELLVAQVLAERRRLPLDLVREGLGGGVQRLLRLEAFLKERLFGQDEAVERVAQRLRLAWSGLGQRRGPLAVLLFLGPTGTGKTELARLLAEFLFGSPDELARFDMSEYMEEHSVARLIGAPPGYLGHDEEGQLTARLRARPHGVVLLDEVEKAHPRVFDVFLQVFDAGRLTDGQGRVADARHSIFVLTSNLGGEAARERLGFAAGAAPEASDAAALEEARRFFRPELLNRVDETLVFRPLGRAEAERIVERLAAELSAGLLEKHGARLRLEPEALRLLTQQGLSPAHGARELRRVFERLVTSQLSALALSGKLARCPAWRLVHDEGGVYALPDEG